MSVRKIEKLVYECDEPGCENDIIEEIEPNVDPVPYGWTETEVGADKLLRHTCDYCAVKKENARVQRTLEKYLAKFGQATVTVFNGAIEAHVDRG